MDKFKEILNNLITRNGKYYKLVMTLAVTVVFVTTYLLILPALTLDKDKAAEQGGIDVPAITAESTTESESETVKEENKAEQATEAKAEETTTKKETQIKEAKTEQSDSTDPLTFEGENYNITVSDSKSVLPGDTQVKVEEIDQKDNAKEYKKYYNDALEAVQKEDGKDKVSDFEFARFYDISLISGGEEIQPKDAVGVKIEYDKELRKALGVEDEKNVRIVHFAENDKTGEVEAEVLDAKEAKVEVTTDKKDQLQEATFEADAFSVYAVVYTVDFHYENGGDYSINGGEMVTLSDLITALEILKNSNYKDVSEFISKVERVEFSDPSLIAVTKITKDTTLSEIEEAAFKSLGEKWVDATIEGSSDPVVEDKNVKAGDWVLTSLAPFNSDEELNIYTSKNEKYTIRVADEQHDVENGEWALEHKSSGAEGDYDVNNGKLGATVSSAVTSTPQERNVKFSVNLEYKLTKDAVNDIKEYHDGYPVLTYDLTDWIKDNPVDVLNTTGRLRANNTTVGSYSVENGVVKIKITNLQWLKLQNNLEGTFKLDIKVDEEKLGAEDEWEFTLPETDEPFKITFKEKEFKTTKTYSISGNGNKIEKDEDGNYYVNYTATIDSPSKLDSLQFIDKLSSNQILDGNVVVESPTGQVLSTSKTNTANGFTVDITTTEDEGKLASGVYTVKYRTKLTDEAKQQLENNYITDEAVKNDSDWKVNGKKDIDGPSTEFKPEKERPQPKPPVKKVNGKTGDAGKFEYGQELNYTLTYGSSGVSLKNTTVIDNMSALQDLVGDVTIIYADGTTVTMPTAAHGYDNGKGVVWNAEEQPQFTGYTENDKTLFSYTFLEDKEGPVTITYKTKVLSEQDAENLNLFGQKDVRNTFVVNGNNSWTVGHVDTQEPTNVRKTIVNNNGTNSYKPGDKVTYTVEYGKPGQNMGGMVLYDSMSDIQIIDGAIGIRFGDGSTETLSSGDNGYVWNNDGKYSTLMTDVLAYTVPEGKTGVITVTYVAEIISEQTANNVGIWDTQSLNNHASTSKGGSDDTHKDVDFGKKPEPNVNKTSRNLTTTSGNWQPGDEIEWTINYTLDDKDMNGMLLEDYMNYLQTYVEGSAKISINGGQAKDMPSEYITYDTNGKSIGKDTQIQVYSFRVNENEPVHSVTITYKTRIIDADTALAHYVNGTVNVNNRAIGEDRHDDDGHDTDFPKIPVDKEVTETNGTESIDGQTWAVGQTVKYTLTYGAEGMQMNNAWIYDQMTDVFKSIGTITIAYKDQNGASRSFEMPSSAVRFNDDGYYSNNKVDVFNYTLPGEDSEYGKIFGPLTITYDATLIDQETATEKGIGGKITVQNDFRTSAGADTVTGYVPYTSKSHDARIFKTGYVNKEDGSPVYNIDAEDIPENVQADVALREHQVIWHIRVEAEEGSAYPLTDLKVTDDRGYYAQQIEGNNQSVNGSTVDLIDFSSARVVTDSGVVLSPGADYTYSSDDHSWYFNELDEPITIEVAATFPKGIVGSYQMSNHVYLKYENKQKESESNVKGEVDDITVKKTGEFDKNTGLITWKVYLNPAIKEYDPDVEKVIFKDDLPDGLELVNYNNGDSASPSIYVDYPGTGYSSGCKREINVEVTDGHFEADVSAFIKKYNVPFTEEKEVQKYVEVSLTEYKEKYSNEAFYMMEWVNGQQVYKPATIPSWDAGGGNPVTLEYWESHSWNKYYVYTTVTEEVTEYRDVEEPIGISNLIYEITYKTKLAEGEWDNITSSESGSKTYVNSALFTDEDTVSWSGDGEVTVQSENPLDKFEVQDRNEGTGDAPDWYKINEIEGSTEDTDRLYWYQLEVNPDAEQLNHKNKDGSLNPLKLTDYIDTKIDIIPTSIQILEVVNGAERDTSNDPDGVRPVAVYNDDTRLLTINNLQDKTHYTIRYRVRVRALYTPDMDDPNASSYKEYIVSNTATLEGGGSWSDTTTGSHKSKQDAATISGGIQLTKIDENDATKTLSGAVFKLYKVDTGVKLKTDDNGNVTNIDTTGMYDDPVVTQIVDPSDPDGDGKPETYTSIEDGSVDFGKNLEANTLYYWIETEFPEGYLGDTGKPHYFVIYYEDHLENKTGIHCAWDLDDIWSDKYGYTVASISGGTVWVANNSRTRSIAITKRWSGDYNNTYKTRPDSVKVDLIQVDEDGNRKVFDSTNLRADKDGNWLAYTNYAWSNLPATYEEDGKTKYYTYTVEEDAVSGYFATYSESEPIKGGKITITNTLIPSKTDIFAEKVWVGDDGSDRPNYIEGQLMRILTDSDGNKGAPEAYGDPVKFMLGSDGKWTYSWNDLPTKDGNGGTYTYTVREIDIPDGYAVTYSDNSEGVLKTTENDPLTITNTGLGSLEIKKMLNGLELGDLTTEQKTAIVFTVTDQDGNEVQSFTLNDMGNGLTKTIDNLPAGTYKVTETVPDESVPNGYNCTSVEYSVEDGQTTVIKDEQAEVEVVNNYERIPGSLKIKKNVTVNGQTLTEDDTSMDGIYKFSVTGPDGTRVKFTEDGSDYAKTDESNGLQEITVEITNGQSNTVEVKGLDPGKYTVREEQHTDTGIIPDQDAIEVTVKAGESGDSTTAIAEITNNKEIIQGYELPHTGGIGTTIFYVLGVMLIAGSGVLLIRKRKKLN